LAIHFTHDGAAGCNQAIACLINLFAKPALENSGIFILFFILFVILFVCGYYRSG
jgi:hypothetical protein